MQKKNKLPGPELHSTSGNEESRQKAQKKHERKRERAKQDKPRFCRGCKCFPFGDEQMSYEDFQQKHLEDCEEWKEFDAKVEEEKRKLEIEMKKKRKVSRKKYMAFDEVLERSEKNKKHKKMSDAACSSAILPKLSRRSKRRRKK